MFKTALKTSQKQRGNPEVQAARNVVLQNLEKMSDTVRNQFLLLCYQCALTVPADHSKHKEIVEKNTKLAKEAGAEDRRAILTNIQNSKMIKDHLMFVFTGVSEKYVSWGTLFVAGREFFRAGINVLMESLLLERNGRMKYFRGVYKALNRHETMMLLDFYMTHVVIVLTMYNLAGITEGYKFVKNPWKAPQALKLDKITPAMAINVDEESVAAKVRPMMKKVMEAISDPDTSSKAYSEIVWDFTAPEQMIIANIMKPSNFLIDATSAQEGAKLNISVVRFILNRYKEVYQLCKIIDKDFVVKGDPSDKKSLNDMLSLMVANVQYILANVRTAAAGGAKQLGPNQARVFEKISVDWS